MDTTERTSADQTSTAYDGFISYSHAADGLLAPRLQTGLQRFAKPWWKRRALRVFRDEASLSANPHLWSSITEALDQSAWFVLLLSPDAAESAWVNQEIEYWKDHKDPERILPVLTDGDFELTSGDVTGDSAPDALRGVFTDEPRWVDLRFAREDEQLDLKNPRFSSAVADIASALRGVPKDELESEEVKQHRRTIRTAWAGAALVGVLGVAATVFGVQSANNAEEAERQADIAAQNEATAVAEAERADANAAEAQTNAEEADQNAHLAQARESAASAIGVVDTDPALATWLALVAIDQTPDGAPHPVEVVNALWRSVSANPLADSIEVGPPGNTFIDLAPDGQFLAVSSSENATLELRSAETFDVEWRYSEETEDGYSKPEFSPDGQRIALPVVGSGAEFPWRDGIEDDLPNRVVILETATGSVLRVLEFPECESLDAATWSLEGDLLAVGTGPGGCPVPGLLGSTWMEVFDTSSWESLAVIDWEGDDLGVRPLFVGADRLAAFPTHSSPRVYETDRFTLVDVLEDTGATLPAGVSLESGLIAMFSNDVLIARLHDLTTGAQVDVLGELESWPSPPFGWTFSPDGRRVAAATGGRILIWDVSSGEQILRFTGGAGANNAAFNPQGSALYSAHLDGTVKLWNLAPGGAALEEVERLETATFINGNRFTVGEDIAAMERIEFEPFGRFVQFFSTESGAFVGPLLPHAGAPVGALRDDRFLILSGDPLGETEWQWQVYDPVAEAFRDVGPSCEPQGCAAGVSVSGTEIGVAYAMDDGIWEWQTFDAETLEPISTFLGGGFPLRFDEDWVLQRVGELAGAFFFTNRHTGDELLRVSIPPIHDEISNSGETVALSGREGAIHLVHTATWDTTVLDLGIGRRRGLSFSPDDSLLAVGDADELLIVDLEQRAIVGEVPVPLVSDVFWFNQSEILIGDRDGLWAKLSLDFGDLQERAIESLALRPLTQQECATYRIDPCPTLEELRGG